MSTMISQSLLQEFDHEMSNTRKILERVPESNPDFAPHPKSMTLARLAGHVSEMPWWGAVTLGQDEFDVSAAAAQGVQASTFTTRTSALKFFDEQLAKARSLLVATTDDRMMATWTLKDKGKSILALPRVAVLRSFVMNHMIHHRAQLGVYLRMNGVPVPGMYGPSADEANT